MQPDVSLFTILHGFAGRSELQDGIIVFFGSYLPYLIPLFLLLLVVSSGYTRRDKWILLISAGAASVIARFGVAELIRYFYQRPRPFTALDFVPLYGDSAWSFPSGHALFFFAGATVLYLHNRAWGVGFFLLAALVAISRVIAGVHYPTDIAAGALLGVLVGYAVFRIAPKSDAHKAVETPIPQY